MRMWQQKVVLQLQMITQIIAGGLGVRGCV
jgi:hypothetical protein